MSSLSVIIPVYNSEEYLEECLNSIAEQTFEDFECICVDDGSTDKSPEIIRAFAQKDTRFKVIIRENGGQAVARNTGLEAASGEYVTFVDSDDLLEKDTYKTVLEYAQKADIVCFGIDIFGNTNLERREKDEKYYRVRYSGLKTLTDDIRYKTDCSPCNKIFKKSIIDRYKIMFPEGLKYEDAAFYWKYVLNIKTGYFIDKYFYKYRRHENSTMNLTFTSQCDFAADHLHIIYDLYSFLEKQNAVEKNIDIITKLFIDYFWLAYNYSPGRLKNKIMELGTKYARIIFKNRKVKKNLIKALLNGKYRDVCEPDLKFWQKIFAVKSVFMPPDDMERTNLYLFGRRIKLRNKNREIIKKINQIDYRTFYMYEKIKKIEKELAAIKSGNTKEEKHVL